MLQALAAGETAGQIAASLGISAFTVQSHVKSILAKLGVHSKTEAVTLAWRHGLAPANRPGVMATVPSSAERPYPTTTHAPARVLVIEDHPLLRSIIRIACEQTPGLEMVGELDDGSSALEACRSSRRTWSCWISRFRASSKGSIWPAPSAVKGSPSGSSSSRREPTRRLSSRASSRAWRGTSRRPPGFG